MKNKHSLISPSNFERRMLCPGSLNAEKDLPEQTSKYAAEGTMLHERTALYISSLYMKTEKNSLWNIDLTEDQIEAVKHAGDYFNKLKDNPDLDVIVEFHEKKFSLEFIHLDMKGTVDSALVLRNRKTKQLFLHIIDYKFGKGVAVDAYKNYQLLMYAMGVLWSRDLSSLTGRYVINAYVVNMHIVQPYIRNSNWEIKDIELMEFLGSSARAKYKRIAENCYDSDAKRIPDKKACQFCKAKPTCYALAKTVPKLDTDVFDLEDDEIAAIYDNRDLIKMYLTSIEEYIKNKISTSGFDGYELVPKMSNRKWTADAPAELSFILGDNAHEIIKKLITITRAEKLVDKETINKLTIKEVSGDEIVKTEDKSIKIFENFNND